MNALPLRAGPLEMVFEPATAFLRHLRLGDGEVVRGIYGAVRDPNWGTVAPVLRDLRTEYTAGGFQIAFEADCRDGEIHFVWCGEVTGTEDGTVTFAFDGTAKTGFLKNRIGLCVLHPILECAGRPCTIEHVDGTIVEGVFPRFISPHQPFRNVRAIAHEVTPGLTARVAFEGEIFEMEDQRNWTDASFKTYGTPLDLPFPVRLEAGARVRHVVTVRLRGAPPPAHATRTPAAPRVTLDWSAPRPLPPIGFGMATTGQPLTAGARETLGRLRPAHLRVDLVLSSTAWPDRLHEATDLVSSLNGRLHAALFLSDAAEQELTSVVTTLMQARPPVDLWLVFHVAEKVADSRWIRLARQVLDRVDSAVPLAAGTNAYFAELNRQRPPAGASALPCFSINPQVHAFDNLSLVEALGAQRSTVESTLQFCARPVVISPVTLRPRFNPNAAETSDSPIPGTDHRQDTGFAAAWTLGTLARLAPCPGLHSLTFYETAGPRGIVDHDGRCFPLFHVFAALPGWEAAGDTVSSEPLRVDALALLNPDGRRRVLLAGLSPDPQRVIVEGLDGVVRIRQLSAEGFGPADTVSSARNTVAVDVPAESLVMLEFTAGRDAPAVGRIRS